MCSEAGRPVVGEGSDRWQAATRHVVAGAPSPTSVCPSGPAAPTLTPEASAAGVESSPSKSPPAPRRRRIPSRGLVPPHRAGAEQGFTLVAILAIMAVMAIMLTVAVQTASFSVKREKEAELIFRGNQIVEAIRLFRARNGRFPNSLVELAKANPRVVRKAWADPVTGRTDWVPIFVGQEGTTAALPGGAQPTPGTGGFDDFRSATPTPTPGPGGSPFPPTNAVGPIVGVHSRSCGQSIKIVDGRDRYCDWKFVFDPRKLQLPSVGVPRGRTGPPGGGGAIHP